MSFCIVVFAILYNESSVRLLQKYCSLSLTINYIGDISLIYKNKTGVLKRIRSVKKEVCLLHMQCNIANFFTGPQRFSGYVALFDTYSIFDQKKPFQSRLCKQMNIFKLS